MKTAIKTNYPKFVDLADFEEELENKFLDKQAPKSVSVPQGSFNRPTVSESISESRAIQLPEFLIFMFFSFCTGFWIGASHVNGVLKQSYPNLQIEQAAEYLLIGLLPVSWIGLTYLYFKTKKGGKIYGREI